MAAFAPIRWLVTSSIGLGGGLAVLFGLTPPHADPPPPVPLDEASVFRVAEVEGSAYVEAPEGGMRRLTPGAVHPCPAALVVSGEESLVVIEVPGALLQVEGDARAVLGVEGRRLQLDRGRAAVASDRPIVELFSPAHGLRAQGTSLRLWLDPPRLAVPSGTAVALGFATGEGGAVDALELEGPQIVLAGDPPVVRPIDERLELSEIDFVRRGRSWKVRGRTSVGAKVQVRLGDVEEVGYPDLEGVFEVAVRGIGEPEVEVEDVLGRRARAAPPPETSAGGGPPAAGRPPAANGAGSPQGSPPSGPSVPEADGPKEPSTRVLPFSETPEAPPLRPAEKAAPSSARQGALPGEASRPPSGEAEAREAKARAQVERGAAPSPSQVGSRRTEPPPALEIDVRGVGLTERPRLEKSEVVPR